ncbi:hypothetical protein A7985_06800 [Pseudoalteromonas luteoviolacea]|uniref:BACON domain-containing protein n=1 Tax=Pseudoalteromonas luteoviolacea TaxID=43657 RepID=A0A1C0TWM4_9GAMM|nr:hypothetical protein [Pseudoalteromonas luteoviolacea]OCQ23644.1 hypothetical protein A7985_06800 [Pseudoalteromonas luteoviolacea]
MIKKIALVSAIALILSGCGGSSSSEQPQAPEQSKVPEQPAPTTNTAPTISVNEATDFLAVDGGSLELSIKDSEDDDISVAIISEQTWITAAQTDTTLTLKFAPTLFDVGQHQVKIELSDGKATTEFDLQVTINENPAQWEEHTLTNELLLGGWATEDESLVLAFNSANKGMAINQGKLGQLLLEKDAQGKLQTHVYDCQYVNAFAEPSKCSARVSVDFKVIANEEDKIRVVYQPQNQTQLIKTLHKQIDPKINDEFDFGISTSSFLGRTTGVSKIDTSGESESIIYAKVLHYGPDSAANIFTAGVYAEFEGGKVSKVFSEKKRNVFVDIPESITSNYSGYLYRNTYKSLDLLYASKKYAIFDTSYEGELHSNYDDPDLAPTPEAKAYIDAYLAPQQGMMAISAITKATDVALAANSRYVTMVGLENKVDKQGSQESESLSYFVTKGPGSVILELDSGVTREASYTISDGVLDIELDSQSSKFNLVNIPNSDLLFLINTFEYAIGAEPLKTFASLKILTEVQEGIRLQDHLSQKFQNPYTGEIIRFEESEVAFTYANFEQPVLQPVEYLDDGSANMTECNIWDEGQCWLPSGVVYNYKIVSMTDDQIILFKTSIAGAASKDIEVFNIL